MVRIDNHKSLGNTIFEGFIIFLIIVNVLLIILDTFDNIAAEIQSIFITVEVFSVVVFTIEYLIRLWTADFIYPNLKPTRARLKYIFSFLAIVDLFAILPFYLPFIVSVDLIILRVIRLLRLFEIFKANRYVHAFSVVARVIRGRAAQLISSYFIIFVLMIISSILMFYCEHDAQPDVFSNALSALWWAISTITTADFGGIYPITLLGKILNSIISILGIALIAVPTGIISAGFLDELSKENDLEKQKEEKHYCPHCGKYLKE